MRKAGVDVKKSCYYIGRVGLSVCLILSMLIVVYQRQSSAKEVEVHGQRTHQVDQAMNLEFFDPISLERQGTPFVAKDLKSQKQYQMFQQYSTQTGGSETYLRSGGYDVTVPYIRNATTGQTVYCMQSSAAYWPTGQQYPAGTPYDNDTIRGILYYGARNPHDIGELAGRYGFDWRYAHYGTQVALWRVLHNIGYPVNEYRFKTLTGDQQLIRYIDELTQQRFQNAKEDFSVSGVPVQFDTQNRMQLTTPLGINKDYDFHVESTDAAVQIIHAETMKEQVQFHRSEQFRVLAQASQQAPIDLLVRTTHQQFAALIQQIGGGVQDMGYLQRTADYVMEQKLRLVFPGMLGSLLIEKAWEDVSHPDAKVKYDLSQVKVRLWSEPLGYDQIFQLNHLGRVYIDQLHVGSYQLEEVEAPVGLRIPHINGPIIIDIKANEQLYYRLNNEEDVGDIHVQKSIDWQQRASISHKQYDLTQIKVSLRSKEPYIDFAQEVYLDALGRYTWSNVPVGRYELRELEVPKGLQINEDIQEVLVTTRLPGTTVDLTSLRNEQELTSIKVRKHVEDLALWQGAALRYEDIKIKISAVSDDVTYEEILSFLPDGTLVIDGLPFGTYEVIEYTAPGYMTKDVSKHIIRIDEQYQLKEVLFINKIIGHRMMPILPQAGAAQFELLSLIILAVCAVACTFYVALVWRKRTFSKASRCSLLAK